MLADHFDQLRFCVRLEAFAVLFQLLRGGYAADHRDFRPDNQAVPVAKLVEIRVMRIVRQTDIIRAHLVNHAKVALVLRRGKGVAEVGFARFVAAVLMAADTAQRVQFPIEEEAFVGYLKGAEADHLGHAVHGRPINLDLYLNFIAEGVLHAVPQMDV